MFLEKEEEGVAPHFTRPLKPVVVEQEKPALMECAVEGKPVPTLKWYANKTEIKSDERRKVTYNPKTGTATLEISKPIQQDEIVYTVEAVNKFGKAQCRSNLVISKSVTVSQPVVMEAPKITKPIKAVAVKPSTEVVLEAEFEGKPTPEVTWFRNGKEIKPDQDFKIDTSQTKTVLKISKKTKQKGGKYEVKAVNPKGGAKCSGSVTVTEDKETLKAIPPAFIQPLQPQIVELGETVIMEAVVKAEPIASFQWFQGSTPITSSPDIRISTVGNRSVLLIQDANLEVAQPITCRAENVVGSVTSTATIKVVEETEWEQTTVLEYPRFVKPLSPVVVMDGEKVTFTCKVTGKPVPKVQWFHDEQPVNEAKDVSIYQDSEGVCMLAISEVFPENAGEYTCQAVNKLGEAICKTSMIVEGAACWYVSISSDLQLHSFSSL